MENLFQDLRYGVRVLLESRSLTAVALIALAIGIGANTAIFSVVNAILLRPLKYKTPDRLVMLWEDHRSRGGPEREWAAPGNFADWRDQNKSFDHVVALLGWGPTLTGQGDPEDLVGAAVSSDLFSALGIEPKLGRDFRADEDQQGAERVVILSSGLWKRRFGADPGIVGNAITLGSESYTVIGVMPSGFKFPVLPNAELWRTLRPALPQGCDRGCVILRVIARLKPGVSIESARADTTALAASLSTLYPEDDGGIGITVVGLQEQMVGNMRPMLLLLLAAVGLVLLMACSNVANLMLAKASAREKEIAIRSAVGASRARIVRQLLTESVLLSVVGGALGLLIASWMVDMLIAFSPPGTPRIDEVSINSQVLAFTFALAVLTGIVSGLAPALQSARSDLSSSLKEGKGGGASTRGRRILGALVVVEVGMAATLLIGAGLLVRSFTNLMRVDPGFTASGVLTMNVALPRARYQERRQSAAFFEELMGRVKSLPGVESAGAVSSLPLGGGGTDADFLIEGRPQPQPGHHPVAWYSSVTPDYFRSLGIRLIKGRFFSDRDTADSQMVVVVSEKFAQRYFPEEEPLGKRIGNPGPNGEMLWREIVGVAADVKHFGLDTDARPSMYLPHTQVPARGMILTVRAGGDFAGLASAVREQVGALDKQLAVSGIQTMERVQGDSVAPRRFTLLLLSIFAGAAVLLAAVGIYGVISYSVAQRSQEIGIRMALGADRGDVLRLVVKHGMLLTIAGVAVGLGGAFGLTRLMTSLLFGVAATDGATFLAVPFLLAGVAFAACLVPGRRATKVDPIIALRYE